MSAFFLIWLRGEGQDLGAGTLARGSLTASAFLRQINNDVMLVQIGHGLSEERCLAMIAQVIQMRHEDITALRDDIFQYPDLVVRYPLPVLPRRWRSPDMCLNKPQDRRIEGRQQAGLCHR